MTAARWIALGLAVAPPLLQTVELAWRVLPRNLKFNTNLGEMLGWEFAVLDLHMPLHRRGGSELSS